MVYIQSTNVTLLQRFPVCFKKVVNSAAQVVFAESSNSGGSPGCVCLCVSSAASVWHINTVWNTFSPASTERFILNHAILLAKKKCFRFVFSVLFESLHSKATSLISPKISYFVFSHAKKKIFVLCMSLSVMSFLLPPLCLLSLPGSDGRVPHHSLWPLAGWCSSLAGLWRFPPAG